MFQIIWKWTVLGDPASNASSAANTVQLESFQVTPSEQCAVDNLNKSLFSYVLMKEASNPDKLLVDLKTFCGMTPIFQRYSALMWCICL